MNAVARAGNEAQVREAAVYKIQESSLQKGKPRQAGKKRMGVHGLIQSTLHLQAKGRGAGQQGSSKKE